MADAEKAIAQCELLEQGYSNNAHDYGGETKYGISKRSFPNEDIPNLTPERAAELLKANYWDFYGIGSIDDQGVANLVFCMIVNMNPINAVKTIQAAVNACGRTIIGVKVDGIMGTGTVQSINSLAPYWLCDRIRLENIRYYLRLVDTDLSQRVNFEGWVRRAIS